MTPRTLGVPAFLLVAVLAGSAQAANSIEMFMFRADDFAAPGSPFQLSMQVNVPDVAGVTGVNLSSTGGANVNLNDNSGGQWSAESALASLTALKTITNGTWTVTVTGSNASTSTFTMTTSGLAEGDFFATPTGVSPANGSTNVNANVVFSWNDPTGAGTPDALVVEVHGSTTEQIDGSIAPFFTGAININSTSWDPPNPLENGQNEMGVHYANFRADLIGALSVTTGSITWSDSELDQAPGGQPNPASIVGSQTIVAFTVPEPASITLLAAGALLIGRPRRRKR